MSTTAFFLGPHTQIMAEGILELVNNKGTEVQDTIRLLTAVVAVGGIVFMAVKSRFALAPILLAGLVAGLLVWLVWNVTSVKDKIGEEIDAPVATAAFSFQLHESLSVSGLFGSSSAERLSQELLPTI